MKLPMNLFPNKPSRPHGEPYEQACAWLSQRDRGLSAREQDEYLQWLSEDERHAAAMARAEATLGRMMQLTAWRREHSTEPNPDLLARPRRGHRWVGATLAAAAAALLIVSWWRQAPAPRAAPVEKSYLRTNERVALPDGSGAELKDGSTLDVRYTAGERRVRLTGGEAQFSVMKDAARPFVVEAGGVAVRAVGTVFDVRLGGGSVEVLVTEGKVRVGPAAKEPGEIFQKQTPENALPYVAAGQRAVLHFATAEPVVAEVSSDEIQAALEWRTPRLHFDETPLADAIAEFNSRNHHQIVLGDDSLGSMPIGGTFRPDNVEGFVRLLSVTLAVRAESYGAGRTVLWRDNGTARRARGR